MLLRSCLSLASLAIVLSAAACGAADKNQLPPAALEILQKAESLEVYSLNPDPLDVKPGAKREEGKEELFHDWPVLGKTTVKNADKGKSLLTALQKGIAENEGVAAACFNPRHGVRATLEGKTVDLVICFECYSLQIFAGDARSSVLTTRSPQAAFDQVIKDAGVALPKKKAE